MPDTSRDTQAASTVALMFGAPCVACQPTCQISTAVRSPQRHQGGARRAGDSRGGECAVGLIKPSRQPHSPPASPTYVTIQP